MNRISAFASPLLLGFEEMERMIDKISRSGDGYPPYNVERIIEEGTVSLRITLAVAGFTDEDLEVLVENNQLIIRGRQEQDTGRDFLHRGIAARQFQKSFVLADGIEVGEAVLKNGLLAIDLTRPEPKVAARKIRISQID
ncbi:MAG: Hsp20 family protein [Nitratireductor sp.]|nr:Hsp20 family protein [Nitratireductor sp.]MCC0022233.1 Hsp20 family protein [Nitratireductor sp.]